MPGIMGKSVLFGDGEGLDHDDLNNIQRFINALISDGVLGCSSSGSDGPGLETDHLYALGDSGAPFENLSGTLTPNFLRGIVAQRLAATEPDGDDAQTLLYFLEEDEANVARPAAVTNPRWDIVTLQLAQANADPQARDFEDASTRALTSPTVDKQRRVTATITWTQGAENASPVEPATPAGHVKLAAFRVAPAATLFDPTTDIRDYRMPIGPRLPVQVAGYQFAHDPADVALALTTGSLSLNAGGDATAFCPITDGVHRVLSVAYASNLSGAATLELWRTDDGGHTVLRDLSALLSVGSPGLNGFDVVASHGEPLWSNGYAAGYANARGALDPNLTTSIGLRFVGGGSAALLNWARFVLV